MQYIIESLQRYVEHRIPTGSFLRAVLENNLSEALGRADEHNRGRIFEIVQYVYNELPSNCWGSKEAVTNWLNPKRHKREEIKKAMRAAGDRHDAEACDKLEKELEALR